MKSAECSEVGKNKLPPFNSGRMKIVADSQETIVVVPVIVKPVQVQVTLALVVVKIGHVAVAVHEADRTNV